MGSENKMNDVTSFQQSDNPILCSNGCGFFGTPATMNLCSKCYRDHKLAASAIAAVEKSMISVPIPSTTTVKAVDEPMVVEPSSSNGTATVPPATNRCGCCNKKVGVMGFKCRCGITFCGSHRYPEEHECSFDFKGAGKVAIAKSNPIVKADKLERF